MGSFYQGGLGVHSNGLNIDAFVCRFDITGTLVGNELNGTGSNDLNIYPNPTNGTVTVGFEIDNPRFAKATVHTLFGNQVRTSSSVFAEKGEIEFDLSNLPAGVYIIRVELGSEIVYGRIVKL